MIKFYGTITSTSPEVAATRDLCTDICYVTSNCIATSTDSDGYCRPYYLARNQIMTVSQSEPDNLRNIVTIFPNNTCPANLTNMVFTMPLPDGSFISWKQINETWKFEQCKDGWKRFERKNNKIVCIKGIHSTLGVLKNESQNICSELRAKLFGVASVEEAIWMRDEATSLTTSDHNVAFWTAGERITNCLATDPWNRKIVFYWKDGITTGFEAFTDATAAMSCLNKTILENCLSIMNEIANRTEILNDVPCDKLAVAEGLFCGYELLPYE